MIYSEYISKDTKGFNDIHDITADVKRIVTRSNISNGIVVISIAGATAAIATIERESGLEIDLANALEILAPMKSHYQHEGNGFSHIRAAMLGSSKTISIASKALILGVWQQIILVDFDNRTRNRKIFVQVMGE